MTSLAQQIVDSQRHDTIYLGLHFVWFDYVDFVKPVKQLNTTANVVILIQVITN